MVLIVFLAFAGDGRVDRAVLLVVLDELGDGILAVLVGLLEVSQHVLDLLNAYRVDLQVDHDLVEHLGLELVQLETPKVWQRLFNYSLDC